MYQENPHTVQKGANPTGHLCLLLVCQGNQGPERSRKGGPRVYTTCLSSEMPHRALSFRLITDPCLYQKSANVGWVDLGPGLRLCSWAPCGCLVWPRVRPAICAALCFRRPTEDGRPEHCGPEEPSSTLRVLARFEQGCNCPPVRRPFPRPRE